MRTETSSSSTDKRETPSSWHVWAKSEGRLLCFFPPCICSQKVAQFLSDSNARRSCQIPTSIIWSWLGKTAIQCCITIAGFRSTCLKGWHLVWWGLSSFLFFFLPTKKKNLDRINYVGDQLRRRSATDILSFSEPSTMFVSDDKVIEQFFEMHSHVFVCLQTSMDTLIIIRAQLTTFSWGGELKPATLETPTWPQHLETSSYLERFERCKMKTSTRRRMFDLWTKNHFRE